MPQRINGEQQNTPRLSGETRTIDRVGPPGEDRFEQLALVGGLQVHPSERTQFDLRARFASWEGDDYPDSSGGPVYGSGLLRQSHYDELSLGAAIHVGAETARRHHRGRGIAQPADAGAARFGQNLTGQPDPAFL